jgi:hypothetical protein
LFAVAPTSLVDNDEAKADLRMKPGGRTGVKRAKGEKGAHPTYAQQVGTINHYNSQGEVRPSCKTLIACNVDQYKLDALPSMAFVSKMIKNKDEILRKWRSNTLNCGNCIDALLRRDQIISFYCLIGEHGSTIQLDLGGNKKKKRIVVIAAKKCWGRSCSDGYKRMTPNMVAESM